MEPAQKLHPYKVGDTVYLVTREGRDKPTYSYEKATVKYAYWKSVRTGALMRDINQPWIRANGVNRACTANYVITEKKYNDVVVPKREAEKNEKERRQNSTVSRLRFYIKYALSSIAHIEAEYDETTAIDAAVRFFGSMYGYELRCLNCGMASYEHRVGVGGQTMPAHEACTFTKLDDVWEDA